MSGIGGFAHILSASAFITLFYALPALALDVPAPCSPALGDRVWRSCSDLNNGVSKGPLAAPGFLKDLQTRTQKQVDGFYNHMDGNNPLSPPGSTTFCNLVDNQYVQPPDPWVGTKVLQNHKGDSCGQYVDIRVDLSISGDCDDMSYGGTVVDNIPPLGTLEGSYIRSGLILADACFTTQVQGELRANHVKVANDSSCLSLAKQVLTMEDQMKTYDDTRYGLNCTVSWDESGLVVGLDSGQDKQVAQKFCAMRALTEFTYEELAACEVNQRGQAKYLYEIGSTEAQKVLFKAINTDINNACTGGCAKCGVTPTSMSACMNKCYQNKIAPFMKGYLEKRFGSC